LAFDLPGARVQAVEGFGGRDGDPEAALFPFETVGAGGFAGGGIGLSGGGRGLGEGAAAGMGPVDGSGAGGGVAFERLARVGIGAEDLATVGGGDPEGLAVESDATAGDGIGLQVAEDFASGVVDEAGVVVALVEHPEAIGRGLQAVGVGPWRAVERFDLGLAGGQRGGCGR